MTDIGRSPDGSGFRPADGAASVSAVPASIPNADNEHGYCPNCLADLDGGSIWQTFYDRLRQDGYYHNAAPVPHDEAERQADEIAGFYGATRTKGQWGRATHMKYLGVQPDEWMCPDCGHRWAYGCIYPPRAAQAIEARRAATGNTDAVHESAVAESDAPNIPGDNQ